MIIKDKTLVAWVRPSRPFPDCVGILAVEDGGGVVTDYRPCDALVLGANGPDIWKGDNWKHCRDQPQRTAWTEAAKCAGPVTPGIVIQLAAVYREQEIIVLRDGQVYATYQTTRQLTFALPWALLIGQRNVNGPDATHFAGAVLDARLYAQALTPDEVARLNPGAPSDPEPIGWWCFADGQTCDRTGHFPNVVLQGGAHVANGEFILDGQGGVLIAAPTVSPEHDTILSAPVPAEVVRTTRLLRERLLSDPYRPGYHFAMSEDMAIPGDPNGAFYHNGRYHLMYLYARRQSGFCWGHLSSTDLVHWRHHPDALAPDHAADPGIFSGGAFVDDDGTAYLTYWKLGTPGGVALARSRDRSFEHWDKLDKLAVASTGFGVMEMRDANGQPLFVGSSDPSNIWKHDGRYYLLTGNLQVLDKIGRQPDAPVEEQGDRLYLFVSDDLHHWTYLHRFYERSPLWTDRSEDNMCPSFLPLPSRPDGGAPSGKHLLLFIAHNRGCQYYLGDYRHNRFHPEHHGRMSWVDNTYFAPEALMDGKGRQVMWAWLMAERNPLQQDGWSGVYGLPRTLWVGEDGELHLRPVPELESLRLNERTWRDVRLDAGDTRLLEGVVGHSCELHVEIEPGPATRVGIKVLASPDEEEETCIYFDAPAGLLVMDTTRGGKGGRPAIEQAPFQLRAGESLTLRVFVDRSIVEVFANDRQAIGRRVFPARSDSQCVAITVAGGPARFPRIAAWEMAAANPY